MTIVMGVVAQFIGRLCDIDPVSVFATPDKSGPQTVLCDLRTGRAGNYRDMR